MDDDPDDPGQPDGPGEPTFTVEATFTVDEARALLAELRPAVDEFVRLRGALTGAQHARAAGDEAVALPDLKAMEAHISEVVDRITARGIQVKGFAPLLLDFPMWIGDRQLLLCWVEGEEELGWWHDTAHGFAGRRPLAELPQWE